MPQLWTHIQVRECSPRVARGDLSECLVSPRARTGSENNIRPGTDGQAEAYLVCWALSLIAFSLPVVSNLNGEWLGCFLAGHVGRLISSLRLFEHPGEIQPISCQQHSLQEHGSCLTVTEQNNHKYTHTLCIAHLCLLQSW